MTRRHAFGFTLAISPAAYQKAAARARSKKATNRDRAVVEVYKFRARKKPAPFVAYVNRDGTKITNFTGLRLCTIQGVARDGKGVHARCIDGRMYHGRSNGTGMWISLRPLKGKR
jgi:hypothetical protein